MIMWSRYFLFLYFVCWISLCHASVPYAWTIWNAPTSGMILGGMIIINNQNISVTYTSNQTASIENYDDFFIYKNLIDNETRDSIVSPYVSDWNSNAPPADSSILQISQVASHSILFSQPVMNPILAFFSLNGGNQYIFNRDFTLLSYAGQNVSGIIKKDGLYGSGPTERDVVTMNGVTQYALTVTDGEGHGIIGFNGSMLSINWVSTVAEYWNGVTVGVQAISNGPVSSCPATCSNGGTCNPLTALCQCPSGYGGLLCQYIKPNIIPYLDVITSTEGTPLDMDIDLVSVSDMTVYEAITWSLGSGIPQGMYITPRNYSAHVIWSNPIPGNYSIDVIARNIAGISHTTVNINIIPNYMINTVQLNDGVASQLLPAPRPITISGTIIIAPSLNEILPPNTQILIYINVPGGDMITTLVPIDPVTKSFHFVFTPMSRYAGRYDVGAIHPTDAIPLSSFLYFRLAGLYTTPGMSTLNTLITPSIPTDFVNLTTLYNPSDVALTINNITVVGMNAIVISSGSVLTSFTLQPGQNIVLGLRINITLSYNDVITVIFTATVGTTTTWMIDAGIITKTPQLIVTPSPIVVNIVRNTQMTSDVMISNPGGLSTGPISITLPTSIYFGISLASMVSSISPNSSVVASILVITNSSTPLGSYNGGSLIINDNTNNLHVTIPITINVLSSDYVNLTIIVQDEYTYFAPGAPNVANATIHLSNIMTGIDIHGLSDSNGQFIIPMLRADTYQLTVQADRHAGQDGVIQVMVGQTNQTVFLSRQAVSYVWTVTPTLYQDDYTFTLDTTFETYVPMPVVVITPAWINLTKLEQGPTNQYITFKITNYGLIRADDLELGLPTSHPFLSFSWPTPIGSLDANTTIYVTVTVTKTQQPLRRLLQSGGGSCYSGDLSFRVQCGGWKSSVITITFSGGQPCPGGGDGGDGYVFGGGGGGDGGGEGVFGGPSLVQPSIEPQCDPDKCLKALFNCIVAFTPLSCANALYNDNSLTGESTVTSGIDAILSCIDVPGLSQANSIVGCVTGIVPVCTPTITGASVHKHILSQSHTSSNPHHSLQLLSQLESYLSSISQPSHNRRLLDADVKQSETVVVDAGLKMGHLISIYQIIFNDLSWGDQPRTPALTSWNQLFHTSTLSTSPGGTSLTITEYMSLNTSLGNLSQQQVNTFLQRYNRSITYWNAGLTSLSLVQAQYGNNSASSTYDFIDRSLLLSTQQQYRKDVDSIHLMGYTDVSSYFQSAKDNFIYQAELPRAGICARVTIRIVQDAVFTRTGFEATLQMSNQDTTDITNITVSLVIFNSNDIKHISALSLFSIGSPTGTLFGNTTANPATGGMLRVSQSGSASWFIIPYHEAAPTTATYYKVGGILSYYQGGTLMTVTLYPDDILVQPDPVLRVKYFMEKYVESQDPFTPQIITPPKPFVLGMLIQNKGAGIAKNMHITSQQPTIIDNQKGLLISFQIIGASFNAQPLQNTLTVTLGDILPATTNVVKWYLTATLAGQFIAYNASFTEKNPNGDPRVSVLESLEYHEMLHPVKITYPPYENDGLSDFLTIDIPSIDVYPSNVHSSHNGSMVYVVQSIRNTSTMIVSSGNITVITFTCFLPGGFSIPAGGYFYARGNNLVPTLRYATGTRQDNSQLDPDNTWTSHRVIHLEGEPDIIQDYVHIFDYTINGMVGPITWNYTLTLQGTQPVQNNTIGTTPTPTPTPTPTSTSTNHPTTTPSSSTGLGGHTSGSSSSLSSSSSTSPTSSSTGVSGIIKSSTSHVSPSMFIMVLIITLTWMF